MVKNSHHLHNYHNHNQYYYQIDTMRETGCGACCSTCLKGILKLLNFLLAFVGLAIVLFALWSLYKLSDDTFRLHQSIVISVEWSLPYAWFIYLMLGFGVVILFITFVGHIAAETSSRCCLSCYTFFVSLLLVLQGAITADIFLNENWESDVPSDSTGLFETIKAFIQENIDLFKWVGLTIVVIEAISVLLALFIRAMIPSDSIPYDSDDEYVLPRTQLRQPLLIPGHTVPSNITSNTTTVEGWPVNR